MAGKIAPEALTALLASDASFALIDVREAGEYNSSHIPGASLIARRQLEFVMPQAVPFLGVLVTLCDDDGRRAGLAAATLERLGYRDVAVLDGGINRWVTEGPPPSGDRTSPARTSARRWKSSPTCRRSRPASWPSAGAWARSS